MATQFKKFDVRRLLAAGIEPFPEIRKRVAALGPNEGLTIIAPFLPSPLIEVLSSEGFSSRVEHQPGGAWLVHFSRDEA
jgi:hypothetical protein